MQLSRDTKTCFPAMVSQVHGSPPSQLKYTDRSWGAKCCQQGNKTPETILVNGTVEQEGQKCCEAKWREDLRKHPTLKSKAWEENAINNAGLPHSWCCFLAFWEDPFQHVEDQGMIMMQTSHHQKRGSLQKSNMEGGKCPKKQYRAASTGLSSGENWWDRLWYLD